MRDRNYSLLRNLYIGSTVLLLSAGIYTCLGVIRDDSIRKDSNGNICLEDIDKTGKYILGSSLFFTGAFFTTSRVLEITQKSKLEKEIQKT